MTGDVFSEYFETMTFLGLIEEGQDAGHQQRSEFKRLFIRLMQKLLESF
jgi:hypothetical protein